MAGGKWSTTDLPVLPGLYLNFQSAALSAIRSGSRGTVAIPVKAHWGPVKEFVDITGESAAGDRFGFEDHDGSTAITSIKLALLGGAKKVLAYRIADSNAAKASRVLTDSAGSPENVIRIDAKYPGIRANGFSITVQDNPVDPAKKDIKLYEGTTLLYTFTSEGGSVQTAVDAINSDAGNRWVDAVKLADGNGDLADVLQGVMSGGDSGIVGIASSDYIGALAALETQDFNLLCLDGVADSSIQTSVATWIGQVREQGKGVMAVLGGSAADDTASDAVSKATTRSASWNHEAVVNVGTGAILNNVTYSSAQLSAFVAGMIAGQSLYESVTYYKCPFIDVTRRWTRSEQELAVKGGVFLLVHDGFFVKALRGVNTLISTGQGQNDSWKKIRTIRVMDAINADLTKAAEDQYIGKVNNTEEGRLALVGAAKQYMLGLAQSGVIESAGWDVYPDPRYYGSTATLTPEPDQVYIHWEAKLTDAMEQIFGTFAVL